LAPRKTLADGLNPLQLCFSPNDIVAVVSGIKSDQIGTLEAGKVADMEDPQRRSVGVTNLLHVSVVIKEGRVRLWKEVAGFCSSPTSFCKTRMEPPIRRTLAAL
jgi:hypothetical protein